MNRIEWVQIYKMRFIEIKIIHMFILMSIKDINSEINLKHWPSVAFIIGNVTSLTKIYWNSNNPLQSNSE